MIKSMKNVKLNIFIYFDAVEMRFEFKVNFSVKIVVQHITFFYLVQKNHS